MNKTLIMKNAMALFNVLVHDVVKRLILVEKTGVRLLYDKMWV